MVEKKISICFFCSSQKNTSLAKNLLTAYAALLALYGKGLLPNGEAILAGWRKVAATTYYIGRWQILRASSPRVIADSAHNAEGLLPVVDRLVSFRGRVYCPGFLRADPAGISALRTGRTDPGNLYRLLDCWFAGIIPLKICL